MKPYGFVKPLFAILFCLTLAWTQLSAAPLAVAVGHPAHACCHCGGRMSCCAAPVSGSQPAPAVPADTGLQKQFSLPAPAIVIGALPEDPAGRVGLASPLFSTPESAPLYVRDCARLI